MPGDMSRPAGLAPPSGDKHRECAEMSRGTLGSVTHPPMYRVRTVGDDGSLHTKSMSHNQSAYIYIHIDTNTNIIRCMCTFVPLWMHIAIHILVFPIGIDSITYARGSQAVYIHTHTHPYGGRGEGAGGRGAPSCICIYILVRFLPFPKLGFFDVIIPDFRKGILYAFVYTYVHFLFSYRNVPK